MSPPRESSVLQLVRANHEQAEKGHTRLRADVTGLEERLLVFETALKEQEFKLKLLASSPQDLSKLTMSAGMVATIVLTAVGIVAGMYGSTWGMRSDIRDIGTRLEAQAKQLDGVAKKQELQQIQIQELRELVLGQQRRTR
jgi:hypothetical protein